MSDAGNLTKRSATDAGELVPLLSEQCDLYRQLAGLSSSQRSLITGNEGERLLAVLGQRQAIIDRLVVLGDRMRPFQANWSSIRDGLDETQGEKVDSLVTEINGLLAGILVQDKADADLLSVRRSTTSEAMTRVKANKVATAAYAAASGGRSTGADWARG